MSSNRGVFIKSGGQWKEIKGFSINTSGYWAPASAAWVKQGGTWKQFFPSSGNMLWNSPGTYTWVVPAGITEIQVDLVGGGGGGGGSTEVGYGDAGGGGGGGGYVVQQTMSVIPGEKLQIVVADGGYGAGFVGRTENPPNGEAGGDSSISGAQGSFLATGGQGGRAGTTAEGGQDAPRGGGGGLCFAWGTLVSLPNGDVCEIQDVKVGDFVLNYDGTIANQVTLIEMATDNDYGGLYSPSRKKKPFATLNHPLYINGKLSSLDPVQSFARYPWLGPTEKINDAEIIPPGNRPVYNLWVTGDGTYQVNGYGTTSIVYDGGLIRRCVDQGIFPSSRASELLIKFTSASTTNTYGAYLCNKFLGWTDIKIVNRILGTIYRDDIHYPVLRAIVAGAFTAVGAIAKFFKGL